MNEACGAIVTVSVWKLFQESGCVYQACTTLKSILPPSLLLLSSVSSWESLSIFPRLIPGDHLWE